MGELNVKIPWDQINDYLRSERKIISPELSDWINESKENQVLFDELTVVQQLTINIPEPFTPNRDMAWNNIESRIKPERTIRRFIPAISKVAAAITILLIGFSISLLIQPRHLNQLTEIHAPKGSKTQVLLPDSSMVILNGGSSLSYANDYLMNRKIELSGEALFDVRKNMKSQFKVHTDQIDIDVFGTRFNVKAYPEDPELEIALLEGSIGLSKNSKNLMKLSPGHVAVLNKASNKIGLYQGNVAKVISWSQDELIFEDKTFEEIAAYLERWYGVEIELDESLKEQHRFTFNVKTETLREVLKLINVISPIDYKIDGKKVKIAKKN